MNLEFFACVYVQEAYRAAARGPLVVLNFVFFADENCQNASFNGLRADVSGCLGSDGETEEYRCVFPY